MVKRNNLNRLVEGSKRSLAFGLDAKASRGIDRHQGDKLDESGLEALIRAAVAHNAPGRQKGIRNYLKIKNGAELLLFSPEFESPSLLKEQFRDSF